MSSSIPGLPGADDRVVDQAGTAIDPSARPFRRTFTAEYRARVVAEYEAAPHGEKSAVLRREGLYQSQVRRWAAAREALARGTSAPRRAHRSTGGKDDPARLRAENQRLARELAKSQAVVEIMGKLQGLLEAVSESTDTSTSSRKR
ncbi:transposase [Nocardioides sp.]|uniref:transposase n=1 Tax=Nocardioides sp. TaxID=35761 RepID=UPI002600F855|nr:transposase [Nocardioides sp.]